MKKLIPIPDLLYGGYVNEIDVIYKTKNTPLSKITSSIECNNIFRTSFNYNQHDYKEYFYAMYLNNASKVLGVIKVTEGGMNSTVVDKGQILGIALKMNARSIILCHNHPSGQTKPSDADLKLTKEIKESAKLLDISLLDHLILGEGSSYLSMSDEGLL